ncbi:hypothetical protein [Actinoplanes sp. URMC 104]|uniref:hypothetical protein n=1 Tax=Actinoplanes sp. URMC 104 TaxID=3423409 RepID=UPI003F19CC27
MSDNKRRRRGALAVLVGLMACSAVVWQSSHAAFSATTSNGVNTLGAGTVSIADNTASAMFDTASAPLAPGASATVCMGVQYTGSLTSPAIRMYFTDAAEYDMTSGIWAPLTDTTTAAEVDDLTTLRIQVSTTDSASNPGNSCAGTFTDVTPATSIRTLATANTDFAHSLASNWGTVTRNQWRTFQFTYAFSSAATNSAQGDAVRFKVVWEAQA